MHESSTGDFDPLLNLLTARQHLSPHDALGDSLQRLTIELGVCPQAVEQSLSWLQLDGRRSIGRLRRTELMQLARTIHRVWKQRLSDVAASVSP